MKRYFFIYSLPRSGSSWLSVLLSSPGCYCYHEPFADGGWPQLVQKLEARPEQCVGAIDTSAHQRPWLKVPQDWATFVLHRHKSEIESSLRMRGWVLDLSTEIEKLDAATRNCIPIYYNYLSDLTYVHRIWEVVTGGLPFDEERASYFMEMNVQRKFASVRRRNENQHDPRTVQYSGVNARAGSSS